MLQGFEHCDRFLLKLLGLFLRFIGRIAPNDTLATHILGLVGLLLEITALALHILFTKIY